MSRPRLLLATRNADKVAEITHALDDFDIQIISLVEKDNLPTVDEDQDTLVGNAIKKASVLFTASGIPSLADDTGLEVDALNGEPGVYSSRYAGESASYEDNINKLLQLLENIPESRRTARFRCVMALASTVGIETVEGICNGTILADRRGENGFGYDPIFFIPQHDQTFAEMTLDQKNKISHRGIALAKMKEIIKVRLHG
jgi:XTP/dITP diphosphohydrolase